MNPPAQSAHTKEAIVFFRSNEAHFVELYAEGIRQCQGNFFATHGEALLQDFAILNIQGIINRFSGIQIDLERVQKNHYHYFEQGATLQDFAQVLDNLERIIDGEVLRLMPDRPELSDFIIQKLRYMRQAYGSTLAIAMTTFQSSKV